ncbi:MAG TPA: helix-turn-helix domain-containing protein, partial [Candidatus Dormibacteraeota bacterium]|nr:helix-turn-helix domain-containing protein [Candidatus Dormibacteraeota bacterium]
MPITTLRHDDALGRWLYHEWKPPLLAGLVDRFWYSSGSAALPRKRIFPNGMVELIVTLGEPMRLVEGKGIDRFVAGTLSGLHSAPITLEMGASQETLGLRLRPAGAYALLARPMGELSDLTLNLDQLVGRVARELVDRLQGAASIGERFQLVHDWVRVRVCRTRAIEPAVAWSAAQIERSAGNVPIADLRAETGLSKTRLVSRFREQIGFSPKRYARVLRFRRALALLHQGALPAVEVALEAGYYDQPHMVADFRTMAGMTPRQFATARRY